MKAARERALVVAVLLVVLTGCGGCATGEPEDSTPSATSSPPPGATTSPFASSQEPVAIEPGTYRIPDSEWSVADFTVTFPEGWTVQHGHVYLKHSDLPDELSFYAVDPDAIYADACRGDGDLMEVGPSVDDLAAALLQQPGPTASEPVETTLGGYPAIRVDLTVPEGIGSGGLPFGGDRTSDLVQPACGQVLRAPGRRLRERAHRRRGR